MNGLWWIRRHNKNVKPFVANRIGEIQDNTNPEQWRYVPTKQNYSDVASRGCSVDELVQDEMWRTGPDFLKEESEKLRSGQKIKLKRLRRLAQNRENVYLFFVE